MPTCTPWDLISWWGAKTWLWNPGNRSHPHPWAKVPHSRTPIGHGPLPSQHPPPCGTCFPAQRTGRNPCGSQGRAGEAPRWSGGQGCRPRAGHIFRRGLEAHSCMADHLHPSVPRAVLIPAEGTCTDRPGFLVGRQQQPRQEWLQSWAHAYSSQVYTHPSWPGRSPDPTTQGAHSRKGCAGDWGPEMTQKRPLDKS